MAVPTMDEGGGAGPRAARPRWRRVVGILFPFAVAGVLLFAVLPAIADFSQVWGTIRGLATYEVAALCAFAVWNILTYQFVTMTALPGLPLRRAFMVGQISTAVSNTVPAGSAAGVGITYTLFSSYGYSPTEVATASVLTGLWNAFAKLAMPLAALVILAVTGDPSAASVSAAMAGLATLAVAVLLLVFVVRNERLAAAIGGGLAAFVSFLMKPFRRAPIRGWDAAFVRFRNQTAHLLARRWHLLTGTTILSHLSLYGLLLLSLRILDVAPGELPWPEVFAAFALVRLVTALPVTPGGLGIVELGLTGALVVAGGPESQVVAAVLVYRALTYALQVPIGFVCWLVWKATSGRAQPA